MPVGAHAVVLADAVGGGVLVIMVVHRVPPVGRGFAFQQRDEAASLHVRRLLCAGDIEKGLGEVEVHHDVLVG